MTFRLCNGLRHSLLWGLFLSAGVATAGEPVELLKRMIDAAETLHYQGTLVEVEEGDVDTFSVIHRADDNGGRERIFSLSGGQRELIRDHDSLRCVYRAENRDDVDLRQFVARMEVDDLKDVDSLNGELYRFRVLGDDRIAARAARVISIEPRDSLRYGFRFWMDSENDMPLRSDMIHPDGTVLEQIMFTRIEYPETVPDDLLAPTLNAGEDELVSRHARLDPDDRGAGSGSNGAAPQSELASLPGGFQLVSIEDKEVGHRGLRHLVLSDGLAQVSVFIEPHQGGDRVLEGERRMGAVSAFGQLAEGQRVTVVGEVPMETIRVIAQAMEEQLATIRPEGEPR